MENKHSSVRPNLTDLVKKQGWELVKTVFGSENIDLRVFSMGSIGLRVLFGSDSVDLQVCWAEEH